MNKIRKKLFVVCVLVMANVVIGCEADDKTENIVIESGIEKSINLDLTDRQKIIAEIEGWPQNKFDMDTAQETTIDEVEEAFQYIEKNILMIGLSLVVYIIDLKMNLIMKIQHYL